MQKNLLKSIVRNKHLHARFLNTLSLMELCGAQKVSRIIAAATSTSFILEHASEEYRHAYYLRKLANKLAETAIESYTKENMLAQQKSLLYIKHLDQRICLLLKAHGLSDIALIKKRAYILTTLAIETRAIPFYRGYQEVLDEEGVEISIKSVLSEEERHLASINTMVLSDPHIAPLRDQCAAIEENLFTSWLQALNHDAVGLALKTTKCDSMAAL